MKRPLASLLSLVLALALGFFVVESAVHSVHHLDVPDSDQSCPVFSTSQHLAGAFSAPDLVDTQSMSGPGEIVADNTSGFSSRSFRPDQGRAPPSAAAA